MPGKYQRVRRVAIGILVLLPLAVGAQAAAPQRPAPSAVGFLDAMLPASLRAWLPSPPAARRAPRRALPVKCGIAIDPNGGGSHCG